MGNKSSVQNSIRNTTINKSTIDSLNSTVNNFVSSTIVSNAASCSASSSQIGSTEMGDINIAGSDNDAGIDMSSKQDSKLTLECLQKAIQQTNIPNQIASSIMQNITNSVDNDTVAKLVNEASQQNKQGLLANPFVSANSKVSVNVNNLTMNESNKKLSNLISNTVENKSNSKSISDCFIKNMQSLNTKAGNLTIIGEENQYKLKLNSSQISSTFASCKQLTEQTSAITSSIVDKLGITIVDDTKNKSKTESEAKSTAEAKSTGLEAILGPLGLFAMLPSIISTVISSLICCSIIIIIIIMMKSGGSGSDDTDDTDTSDTTDT